MLIIDLSDPARLILLHCSFMFIRIKGMTLLLVRSTHIYYIMCLRAACLAFCSQSVKDRVSVPSFLESECKGTTFFRTDQTFRKLFSRKTRKKWERDKKMEDLGRIGTRAEAKTGKNTIPKPLTFISLSSSLCLHTSNIY